MSTWLTHETNETARALYDRLADCSGLHPISENSVNLRKVKVVAYYTALRSLPRTVRGEKGLAH